MKKLFAVLTALALAAAVAGAQSLNDAKEAFNNGVQAMDSNKTEALAQFRSALEIAVKCTEEEDAAEFIGTCQTAITGALLSIAKEQINEAAYDEAIATLKEAKAAAAEYVQEDVLAEADNLIPNVYMRKGSTQLKNKEFAAAAATFKELGRTARFGNFILCPLVIRKLTPEHLILFSEEIVNAPCLTMQIIC